MPVLFLCWVNASCTIASRPSRRHWDTSNLVHDTPAPLHLETFVKVPKAEQNVPQSTNLCPTHSHQLAELLGLAECCCPKSTHPRSSSQHHNWMLAVLSKVIFVATPQLSVPRRAELVTWSRARFFSKVAPAASSVTTRVHQLHSQLLLISASVIKPRRGATGKRRPDKSRVTGT